MANEDRMVVPSISHSGFERKEPVLGVLAPEQTTEWTRSPHSPSKLWKDATVWKQTSQSGNRGLKAHLKDMLLLLPRGGSQGQTGKLL
mgnify:CR=1 FL=1